MPNSPNMNLPEPVVGTTPAPDWATLLVSCLDIIDGHSHTTGSGVPITPGAININSDLAFASNNASGLKASIYTAQSAPIAATGIYLGCTYVSGVDLYFNDVNGNQVRITQSGGVAGSPGSITGLVSPASASFVGASGRFIWQSDANVSADMDFAAAIMRNTSASSFALTLQPPTLGANYSITLPALPASQKIMTMDASGVMAAPYTVDGSTIAIAANVLGVPTGGITTTQIAASTIVAANIAASTITTTQIASTTIVAGNIANSTLTGTQMSSSINLPGNAVQENGKNVMVSGSNASTSLALVRGSVASNGSITDGEGFTITKGGANSGQYTINISNTLASAPSLTGNAQTTDGRLIVGSRATSSVAIQMLNSAGSAADIGFNFILVGPR